MHTDLNKTKLTLAYILAVLVLISVWTELLVGESFMNWDSNFGTIALPNIANKNQTSESSSSANLSINGDVEISADNSTNARLSSAGDTLVTEYKLEFDGDGITETGRADTDYQPYNEFLNPAVRVTHVTNPDDNDVVVTLRVKASSYANDIADAGIYTATQTLTVTWGDLSEDTTPPAAPTGLTATAVSSSQIDLDWADNTEADLAKYKVYRSTDGVSFTFVAETTVSTYSDTGLLASTIYYYVVTAVDTSDNESAYSNEASVTTLSSVGTGLRGDYYDNADLTNLYATRIDSTVEFYWSYGSPISGMGNDTFSVRWTGYVQPLYSETYTFTTFSEDGDRLWVNGQLLIDDWQIGGYGTHSGTIALVAGQVYTIKMEFFDNTGLALVWLKWSSASQAEQIIPQSQLYPP